LILVKKKSATKRINSRRRNKKKKNISRVLLFNFFYAPISAPGKSRIQYDFPKQVLCHSPKNKKNNKLKKKIMIKIILLVCLVIFYQQVGVSAGKLFHDVAARPLNASEYGPGLCGNAPSCGTEMHCWNGVCAYSNGPVDQCSGNSCDGYGTYGLKYQCVELTQRYFAVKHGTKNIWGGNAIDLCNTKPAGVVVTNDPQPGDAIVINLGGSFGHTAVIMSVTASDVTVMEQNNMPTGVNTYPRNRVICYLHFRG
jgi:hypothetical protein